MDLNELEAIKQLKYRYMRCVDQKKWDEVSDCFTPNATAAYSNGKYSFDGREAIMKFLAESMGRPSFFSSHQISQPEIQFQSEDEATGTWALQDVVIETEFGITIRGAAFYEDRYVKQDGAWKIAHTGYDRTYEEMESRKDNPNLRLTYPAEA